VLDPPTDSPDLVADNRPPEPDVSNFPNLSIVDHPLVRHKLTVLRRRDTSKKKFKELVDEIAMLMAYEVTKDLPMEEVEIETPLETTTQLRLAGKKLTVVPILRAGLGMVDGVVRLMPSARIGHIGLYRDHETLQPVSYFLKIPPEPAARDFVIVDPMLATGGSASAAVTSLREHGAERIRFMCLVAAPEGVQRMLDDHPDVPIHTAALDRCLDENGYIRPGLGDAGDRLFGTR
jgi:uracil phosphoribosyltransferase